MIEVQDLVKRYGGRAAVDHLSFTVETGQVYGFLGPNGAGKSTTMNMMTGYLAPTSGTILVDGHSLADDSREAKRRIGYLPELPPLYTDMTVEEYLSFAAELKGVPRAGRGEQLEQVLEMTWLGDVRRRLIRNLSKGYRQRVGLAQALLGFPDILILDEPTVGLDPKQIIEIRGLIRTLAKKHTIILSSHILSEIQEVCDHILIIHHGKKMADGSPAELEAQLAGPSVLRVTVKGDGDQARECLAPLPGVTKLTPCPAAEEGSAEVELEYTSDVREAVFRACAQQGLPILEMRRSTLTLEEIFLKLTSDEGALPPADEGPEPRGDAEPAPDPAPEPEQEPEPDGQEEESEESQA